MKHLEKRLKLEFIKVLVCPNMDDEILPFPPEVAAAKEAFHAAFKAAEMGKHAEIAPVNNDLQADQIANAYIDDTEDVAIAKAAHMTAVEEAEAAAAMEATEVKIPVAAELKMAMPVVYHQQPLVYYQIPHYKPYSLYGR